MAIFHAVGAPLVDSGAWPKRETDAAWRAEVIEHLERWGADDAHIEALRRDESSVRYHPREVAGASTSEELPATFDQAVENGRVIEDLLRQLRP